MVWGYLWTNLKCLQCQPSGRIWVCHSYIHTGHCISTPWGGPCLELVGHIQMGVSKPLPASCQAGGGCCEIHILNVLHNTTMSYSIQQCPTQYKYILHNTWCPTQYNNVLHNTTMSYTIQQCPTQYNNVLHNTNMFYTIHDVLHNTTMSYIIQQCPTQYNYVLHNTTMSYTIQICPT